MASVHELPQYSVQITEDDLTSYDGKKPVTAELTIGCGLLEDISKSKTKKQRGRSLGMTSILTVTSELELIDFRRISCVYHRALTEVEVVKLQQDESPQRYKEIHSYG